MSNIVDNRVVEMQFDNKDFEKNVETSMRTLDELKKELKMEDAADGLDGIGKAARDIDLSVLSESIQSISDRFSTMGVIGMTVISELTKSVMHVVGNIVSQVGGLIKTGGLTRALNIEKAKFQLEGLGVAWEDIYDNIDKAVTGTAYSLDSAALVASQLVASGVEYGDELSGMAVSLRAISGVAAMTSSTYDEIGEIFTTVAGQGRLMTMQLRQLESRGLNAAATLGKQLGKSEAEIRDMVTKGQIDFETFSTAMNEAFGDHAMEANKTLTGVLANTKSALGRIGAEFISPLVENEGPMVNMIEQIRLKINELKNSIGPIANLVTTFLSSSMESIGTIISNFDVQGAMSKFYSYFFKVWKVVYILRDALKIFAPVIKTIKDAFSEMLPYSLMQGIGNLTERIHKFTQSFRFTEIELDKINRSFKGFFAVIDIGIQILKGLLSPLMTAMGFGEVMADGFLDASAGIGDFLVKVDELVKESGIFNTIGQMIAKAMTLVGGVIAEIGNYISSLPIDKYVEKIKTAFSGLDSFMSTIKDAFNSVGDIDSSGFEKFVNNAAESLSPLETFASALSAVFDKIVSIANYLISHVGSGIKAVGNAFKETGQMIWDTLTGSGNMGDALKATTIGVVLFNLKNVILQLRKLVQGAMPTGTIVQGLNQLSDTLFQMEKSLNADYYIKLATAVIMLAVALKMLSDLNPEQLATGLSGVTALVMELSLTFKELSKTPLNTALMYGSAKCLITFAEAVLILTFAVRSLSKLSWEELAVGLAGVTALLGELVAAAVILGTVGGKMMTGTSGMIMMAIAIRILAESVKEFAGMKPEELCQGLMAVGRLLLYLGAFAVLTSGSKGMISTGIGMIAMAAAIKILTSSVAVLGSMNIDELNQGLKALGIILAELAAFATLQTISKGMLSTGVGMIAMAAAILILTKAVEAFGKMDPSALAQGLIGVGVLLAELAVFSALTSLLGPAILISGVALIAMAAGIMIMVGALELMANMSADGLKQSLIALAILLAELAVAATLMIAALPGAAAMLVMAAALSVLVPTIMLLGALPASVIAQSLKAIAAALGIFLAAAALSIVVAPGLIVLTASLVALGVATTLIGAGLAAIGAGLTAIIGAITAFATLGPATLAAAVESIKSVFTNLVTVFPEVTLLLTSLFNSIYDAAIEVLPKVLDLFEKMITGICQKVVALTPVIITTLLSVFTSLLQALVTYTPQIINYIGLFITELLIGLTSWLPVIIQAGTNLIVAFIQGVSDAQVDLINAAFDAMISFIEGLADAIDNNTPRVINAINKLFNSLINAGKLVLTNSMNQFKEKGKSIVLSLKTGITGQLSNAKNAIVTVANGIKTAIQGKVSGFTQIGKNIVQGLINGLNSMLQSAIDSASALGTKILNAAKASLGIQSPSRKFMEVGKFVDLGLINGLKKYSSKVVDTAADVALTTYDTMSDALSGVSSIMSDIDGDPVITPVLDLTNVRNGASEINGLLATNQANSIAANMTVTNNADMMLKQTSALADMIKSANNDYTSAIIDAITNANGDVTVNVQLSGDASSIFKVVRTENQKFTKATGRSAFA